jgi:hypothetical protein
MGNNREDFEVWLRSRFDGDALKAAQHSFDQTRKKANETDNALKDMGYSAETLKKELMGLLAFAEVVAQFKEGFEQVAALEQAMNQLERATKRNGDNFDVVKGKIVGMAESTTTRPSRAWSLSTTRRATWRMLRISRASRLTSRLRTTWSTRSHSST